MNKRTNPIAAIWVVDVESRLPKQTMNKAIAVVGKLLEAVGNLWREIKLVAEDGAHLPKRCVEVLGVHSKKTLPGYVASCEANPHDRLGKNALATLSGVKRDSGKVSHAKLRFFFGSEIANHAMESGALNFLSLPAGGSAAATTREASRSQNSVIRKSNL